jgi:hypothetical protein
MIGFLLPESWNQPDELKVVAYCLCFAGSQVDLKYRKRMVSSKHFSFLHSVKQKLTKNLIVKEYIQSHLPCLSDLVSNLQEALYQEDWLTQLPFIRQIICAAGKFSLESYMLTEGEVLARVYNELRSKDIFRHETTTVFTCPIPWQKFVSAFDLEKNGLFYFNSEGLQKVYDQLVLERKYDVDGRVFRPVNVMMGKRFFFKKKFKRN